MALSTDQFGTAETYYLYSGFAADHAPVYDEPGLETWNAREMTGEERPHVVRAVAAGRAYGEALVAIPGRTA